MNVGNIRSNFCKMKYFIFFVMCVQCARSDHSNIFDFEQIKNDLFSVIDNEFSNVISETESLNSTEYHNCLNELSAIKYGLSNFEQWAIKMIDAWGKMPSGILGGNLVDFGSFSQCFHIKRNEEVYHTQYCLGQLTFHSKEMIEMMDKNLFVKPPRNFPTFDIPGPGFSFAICMPATCSVEHLEHIFNDLSDTKSKGVSIKIPPETCQKEENASKLKALDLAVIYFLVLVSLLVVASTSYDVSCTLNNQKKVELFLVFSFYTNGKKLLSYNESKSSDTIECLHGIRGLSSQWIVFGHACLPYAMYPVRNKATMVKLITDYSSMIIASAPIAVDTFLVLSGLLVSLNILKHLEKYGKINIPKLYFHRYLRLTPLLCVVFLVSMTLMRFWGNGPLWPVTVDFLSKPCEQYWWSTLLYIQNYVNPSGMCLMHTWYLSVDMQLFLFAPFVIYSIFRLKTKAIYVLVVLVLGCICATLYVHVEYGLKSLREDGKMELAYFPTHIRYSSWLIGVIGGYVLFECRKKTVCIPKTLNLVAWTISSFVMLGTIFANYPLQQLDSKSLPLEFGLYDALSRVGWSLALCYIIFACVHNSGGYVNWFLSHPYWQPISRLCYSTYLLHVPVNLVMAATIKTSLLFSQLAPVQDFVVVYPVTIIVSIIATLAFESPIVVIEKLISKLAVNRTPHNTSNEHHTHQNGEPKQKLT